MSNPVLNILVVGFHHKKGCQVEFCYPPLVPDNPTELPPQWRHLPALALPDGSHNYLSDTLFFHLPSLNEPDTTVYAISCFRQIPIEQVTQRTEDMTRSSVQKSVCVVCRIPFYGRLSVKMKLVVQAWFLQGDFSQTQLLEDAFNNLNNCPVQYDQCLEGLSASAFIEHWRHKSLLLFKLLLLQKKVVMHGSPAGPVTINILTLLSLLPECIESGLTKSANIVLSRPLSPQPTIAETKPNDIDSAIEATTLETDLKQNEEILIDDSHTETRREKCHSVGEKSSKTLKPVSESLSNPSLTRDVSVEGLSQLVDKVDVNKCGFPLQLYTDGHLCLPYLCLQYLDLLSDPVVEGFLIGASNELFKTKRHLFDVLIEYNDQRIETSDIMLKRQLQLTTEDLRFADHVVRYASTQGDAWIREQFTNYLLYLLRASLLPEGSRDLEAYNVAFMSAFKSTPSYLKWLIQSENGAEIIESVGAAHPFGGQLSVADMKLRLAHSITSTEGGRRVTMAVAQTGKAVGGALVTARGAVSNARGAVAGWWASVTAKMDTPDTTNGENSEEDVTVNATGPVEIGQEGKELTDLNGEDSASCSNGLAKIQVV